MKNIVNWEIETNHYYCKFYTSDDQVQNCFNFKNISMICSEDNCPIKKVKKIKEEKNDI